MGTRYFEERGSQLFFVYSSKRYAVGRFAMEKSVKLQEALTSCIDVKINFEKGILKEPFLNILKKRHRMKLKGVSGFNVSGHKDLISGIEKHKGATLERVEFRCQSKIFGVFISGKEVIGVLEMGSR